MCIIDENLLSIEEKANKAELKAIYKIANSDIKNVSIEGNRIIEIKLKRKYAGKERKWDKRLL